RTRFRPGHRGIWLGDLHCGQSPHGVGNHASAHHFQARAVRLCGRCRHRHGHAWVLFCPVAVHQCPAMVARPSWRREGKMSSVHATAADRMVRPGWRGHAAARSASAQARQAPAHLTEPRWVRMLLLLTALGFLGLFLFAPLITVFAEALRRGTALYFSAISDPDAWAAIRLTLLVAAISLPANLIFGVAVA